MSKKPDDKTASTATEVAAPAATSVLPYMDADFMADAGSGMEGADKDSFAIPFLTVIQKMSPQMDEASSQYDPDAKAGMLMNTVTGEYYDGKVGVVILPCHYQRRFVRWGARDAGGGFKGELMPEAVAHMTADGTLHDLEGRLYFPAEDGSINPKRSDRLSDTRNHFALLEGGGNVLLSLTSTQIKKSKALMSMLSGVRVKAPNGTAVCPPTWANRVRVTTVLESNDQGSWYGVKFTLEGMTKSAEDYAAGKAFYMSLREGRAGEVRYQEPAPQSDAF
jgi:hypothetical protein